MSLGVRHRGRAGMMVLAGVIICWGVGVGLRGEGVGEISGAAFRDLPPATRQAGVGAVGGEAEAINDGTEGWPLSGVKKAMGGARTIVILGDLSPVNVASAGYVKQAVRELNLLSPDAVFTVGNLVPGLTHSGREYADEVMALRADLDRLKMPWYPCAGERDVASGERDPRDRRFEGLYQKYFGPLYYSVQVGETHVIVLDSEEQFSDGSAINERQLAWLKDDLKQTFGHRQESGADPTQYVIVLLHRPLWRLGKKGNWNAVHDALVEFNRRPIVNVEGIDGGAAVEGRGPRVVAVYAGGTRAYSDDGLRDGIRYVVLGATAARLQQDAAVDIRGFAVLKFDPAGAGVHPAMVELGAGAAAQTVASDIITASERALAEKIEGLPNETLGVVGVLNEANHWEGDLKLMLHNPLEVPLDVEIRLASTRNLSTPTLRENANPFVESFDRPWEMSLPYWGRHLVAGGNEAYRLHMILSSEATEVAPPQVEFVVHWADDRGRPHAVILKRKVALVPAAEVLIAVKAAIAGAEGWTDAMEGGTYAWDLRGDEPAKWSPEWALAADSENLLVRVRVEDAVHSYTNDKKLDGPWGGLGCDAVSVAWAANPQSAASDVERVWVLPFGPAGPELWSNRGIGEMQTPLQKLDEKRGVKAQLESRDDGYTVTLSLPRKMVLGADGQCVMNIAVRDNDNGAQTWARSWAKEELGPEGWGRVTLKMPEPSTPIPPAATRPRSRR